MCVCVGGHGCVGVGVGGYGCTEVGAGRFVCVCVGGHGCVGVGECGGRYGCGSVGVCAILLTPVFSAWVFLDSPQVPVLCTC